MRTRLDAPLPALRQPPLTVDEALHAITSGSVRLLTSDVFDTVLWRPVASPHHLFTAIGERLIADKMLAPGITGQTFALNRTHAERVARRKTYIEHESPECTLEEIWGEVPPSTWASGVNPASGAACGIAAELAVEAAALKLHPTALSLIEAARATGCQIALVSDSYFSIEQLSELLIAAGLDLGGIDVETSSTHRLNKWDGLLQLAVAARGGAVGLAQPDVLHLGDNAFADLVVGDRVGARVCHLDVFDADDAALLAHEPWELRSIAVGSDGGRSAAVRETLVAAPVDLARSPSYQFGVEVAGPLMAGFAGWVSATADELGANHIHCLLREGGRIAELIDIVRPSGPPRQLVHASRWAIMRAAVMLGTPVELERALARRANLSAEHVSAAFGCNVEAVANVIGGPIVAGNLRADAFDAIAADASLRDEIVAASAGLRRNVMAYLDRTLHLDDGPLVVTDIGWGGTIQEGLRAILDEAGFTSDIVGLYALLSPPGERRAGSGALLHSYLPTIGYGGQSIGSARVAARHPEFLERINTPAIGTLLSFTEAGDPETQPDDHDNIGPSLRAAQRGVIDFCTTAARLGIFQGTSGDEWFGDDTFAATALDSLVTVIGAPDPRLAAELGTWEHDDVAGTAAEALSNDRFGRWAPFANGVDVGEITMNEVYWVPGVASAAGTSLASQIAALAGGSHPDIVCPPSATGLARIAYFPPGSDLASSQLEVIPRIGTAGWMLLQHHAAVPGLRSIRIDVASEAVLVEFGDARVVVNEGTSDELVLIDSVDELRELGTWVNGRWLGTTQAVALVGGHVLVDLPVDVAPSVKTVSVTAGVRTWAAPTSTTAALLPRWRAALRPEPAERVVRRLRDLRHR
jgi:hypothetical protein